MVRLPFFARLALALAGAGVAGGCGGGDGMLGGKDRTQLAMIPKGTTHVFWKAVETGARRAAAQFDVDLIWKGPVVENDRAQQIQLVQRFTAQEVDGILLAPLDAHALLGPVRAARAQGLSVVIFDSALEGEPGTDWKSLVATNNEEAGRLGGAELARLLAGKGRVVVLRYLVGSASTDQREAGCLAALADAAGIEVVVANRYAGATVGEAKTAALNLIDALRSADGIFCPNESSTQGMLLALRQEGLAGRARFVGFDASPPLVEALERGEIDALVVQDPRRMGFEAVRVMVATLAGEDAEPTIDTGAEVVTRETMDEPGIAALLR
jgi:ribose transport system substrate-binding protein